MFPPGYFAPDYFAPGYWADTGEAETPASGLMAAVIAAGASLTAAGVVTSRQVQLAGGSASIRNAWPRHQIFAAMFASVHGASGLSGQARGTSRAGAMIQGRAFFEIGTAAEAKGRYAEADNAFWALAA
jgi:hypothetical protein